MGTTLDGRDHGPPDAPGRRTRLDTELVRRGLARSREHAADLITSGNVRVDGRPVCKPASRVAAGDVCEVDSPGPEFVSRGGHKLAGALEAFGPLGLTVDGRRCLDAGASTGGFTDVPLRAGARQVVAVDVGHDQLVAELRDNPAVDVHERTHVRDLRPTQVGGAVDLLVADLSFISLATVLPALAGLVRPGGDLVVLVKPQFEVGRSRLGKGGVVRELALRHDAVRTVAVAAGDVGLGVAGATVSPLPGPAGNTEYFLWLRADAPPWDDTTLAALDPPGSPKETSL
ncbi:23S rRNA (cytidine1920-2'-O)/16S rRNA (cytidine1409-2'-O)-methyltransferase [Actinopolymorpha cephalotaxi]|uniref:23S rRNA (Cytidine1920-2'-O)/16S rRNA (Cytidine1409-2'-O)-methyltransferase n=1 Tax=Actinopolymorpha cephalotaxi TaxID=504797 RepID=A0A1I2VV60_9ACTN|nr:TlyA family RNA methyltransferase [Actinopolymorpha cephalotaxi]NYH83205.1 23S rRNA (cytidine1920-2'-O)/16S rRNA (cytidine1409-2'-O)-methyltransferase [Actinopolymorpha cephalotaxi]SFG91536.1 23S rRNA (cytidine1920-2'-O)/16S rRNA (cytidine1409-2'-O)-methyltransferase [Actinopolymorpha cephalotaxi]